ncbi:MAG: helix-turn-helix transcriptional regulator [Bacteroidales bacterium]|jgi:transcriptional regulator with XRE-family HTH domain|nr:helix-turn-helix transcriptional regulator [Bacteroidales bacterium]
MNIGIKIKLLRAEMGWSQAELAVKINADQAQINGYERGEALPSIGVIKRLANIFNVTTNYLLFEENNQKASTVIKGKELLELFNQIEDIDPKDKKTLLDMMKIIVIKNRMQAAAKAS